MPARPEFLGYATIPADIYRPGAVPQQLLTDPALPRAPPQPPAEGEVRGRLRLPVRVIIKKDSGTQKKDSRRTPFLAK